LTSPGQAPRVAANASGIDGYKTHTAFRLLCGQAVAADVRKTAQRLR
jgi:hypothetical protein